MSTDAKPDAKPTTERERTEELLAGFDRTGRTPKTPSVAKDFVDFHAQPVARSPSTPRPSEPTFVVRSRPAWPAWLTWASVVVGMLAAGAAVAWMVRPVAVSSPEAMPSFRLPAPSGMTAAPPPSPSPSPTAVERGSPAVSVAPSEPSARPRTAPRPSGFLRQL